MPPREAGSNTCQDLKQGAVPQLASVRTASPRWHCLAYSVKCLACVHAGRLAWPRSNGSGDGCEIYPHYSLAASDCWVGQRWTGAGPVRSKDVDDAEPPQNPQPLVDLSGGNLRTRSHRAVLDRTERSPCVEPRTNSRRVRPWALTGLPPTARRASSSRRPVQNEPPHSQPRVWAALLARVLGVRRPPRLVCHQNSVQEHLPPS